MANSFLNRTDLPLGLRNNNPGNIRVTTDSWQGMIGSSGGFVTFQDVSYGIRAMATILGNDILAGKTLGQIISEYAPSTENNTAAYIQFVSGQTGFASNQQLEATPNTLFQLIRAMLKMEIGSSSSLVTDQDIYQGLNLLNSNLLSYFGGSGTGGAIGSGLLIVALITIIFILNK